MNFLPFGIYWCAKLIKSSWHLPVFKFHYFVRPVQCANKFWLKSSKRWILTKHSPPPYFFGSFHLNNLWLSSRCCEKTMLVMHNNQQSLLTILQVLLYDPLYNWTLSPGKAHQLQQKQQQRDTSKKNNNNNSSSSPYSGESDADVPLNSGKLYLLWHVIVEEMLGLKVRVNKQGFSYNGLTLCCPKPTNTYKAWKK